MKKIFLLTLITCSLSVAFAQTAGDISTSSAKIDSSVILNAKQAPWFVERFKLSAGFLNANNNTSIRIGNSSGQGTTIDFEKDLGFNTQVGTFLSNFQWRSSRRSRFDLSYYQLNRSSTATLTKTIVFQDHTYTASANVSSVFNNSIYRFSWGYALLAKPKAELGLMIGTHVMETSIGLAVNGGGAGVSTKDDFTFTAPLPDLGIWGGFSMGPKWAFTGELSYLSITSGDVSGKILAYNAALLFTPVRNLSLSLGYSGFDFNVDVKTTKQNGSIAWGHNGPSLTATYSFGRKSWVH